MPHRLARGCAGVEADVVPIRRVLRVEPSLDVIDEFEHRQSLGWRRLPPFGDEPAGDHQGVAGADREPVADREGQFVASDPVTGIQVEEDRHALPTVVSDTAPVPFSQADEASPRGPPAHHSS